MKEENQQRALGEINIGDVKYLHEPDDKYDFLKDISDNEVKIHLKFTKDEEKRNVARNALKTFFEEIL